MGWAFPVLGSIHLLGIVCGLGAVALMNLRLLGVGAASSPARLWRETLPIVLVGLAMHERGSAVVGVVSLVLYALVPLGGILLGYN